MLTVPLPWSSSSIAGVLAAVAAAAAAAAAAPVTAPPATAGWPSMPAPKMGGSGAAPGNPPSAGIAAPPGSIIAGMPCARGMLGPVSCRIAPGPNAGSARCARS